MRNQQKKVEEAHKMGAETDILYSEFDATEKAERSLQLSWEQEYSTVCRETEHLERKSLDQRMKETKHLTSKNGTIKNVSWCCDFPLYICVIPFSIFTTTPLFFCRNN